MICGSAAPKPLGRRLPVLFVSASLAISALACGPLGAGRTLTPSPEPAPPTLAPSPLPPTPTSAPNGTIAGRLSYPSEYIPRMSVVAFDADLLVPIASVQTASGQKDYEVSVPPGVYFVVSYTLSGGLAGGYSAMVPCGLHHTCTDHTLLPVEVEAGATTFGIDPMDWYAPDGAFPPAP